MGKITTTKKIWVWQCNLRDNNPLDFKISCKYRVEIPFISEMPDYPNHTELNYLTICGLSNRKWASLKYKDWDKEENPSWHVPCLYKNESCCKYAEKIRLHLPKI